MEAKDEQPARLYSGTVSGKEPRNATPAADSSIHAFAIWMGMFWRWCGCADHGLLSFG